MFTASQLDIGRDGFGMKPPAVEAVPPRTFASWMTMRGQLGGQHKVPRIIHDEELFGGLQAHVAARSA